MKFHHGHLIQAIVIAIGGINQIFFMPNMKGFGLSLILIFLTMVYSMYVTSKKHDAVSLDGEQK